MRNFISLVRTFFGSVSPVEVLEGAGAGLEAAIKQSALRTTSGAALGETGVSELTSSLVDSGLVVSIHGGNLLIDISVVLVRVMLLVLLRHAKARKARQREVNRLIVPRFITFSKQV